MTITKLMVSMSLWVFITPSTADGSACAGQELARAGGRRSLRWAGSHSDCGQWPPRAGPEASQNDHWPAAPPRHASLVPLPPSRRPSTTRRPSYRPIHPSRSASRSPLTTGRLPAHAHSPCLALSKLPSASQWRPLPTTFLFLHQPVPAAPLALVLTVTNTTVICH